MGPGLLEQAAAPLEPALTSRFDVTLDLIDGLASAYEPAVTPGAVAIAPVLLDRTAAAIDPIVTGTGATQHVSPALLDRTALTLAPTIGALVAIQPGLLDRTAAAVEPSITARNGIAVGLIDRSAVAIAPALSFDQVVAATLIDQAAIAFGPRVRIPGAAHPSSQVLIFGPHG